MGSNKTPCIVSADRSLWGWDSKLSLQFGLQKSSSLLPCAVEETGDRSFPQRPDLCPVPVVTTSLLSPLGWRADRGFAASAAEGEGTQVDGSLWELRRGKDLGGKLPRGPGAPASLGGVLKLAFWNFFSVFNLLPQRCYCITRVTSFPGVFPLNSPMRPQIPFLPLTECGWGQWGLHVLSSP